MPDENNELEKFNTEQWKESIERMIEERRADPDAVNAFPYPDNTVMPPVEIIPFDPTQMQSTMPVGKSKKSKSKFPFKLPDNKEAEDTYPEHVARITKLAKLEEAAKKVLAQYKTNHKELRYPGMQELSDALDLPNS